jgi:hypothetical protein
MIPHKINWLNSISRLASAVSILYLSCCFQFQPQIVYEGSFHANDSGESHGGFEWAGKYSAHLEVRGRTGKLYISFETGLGDYLKKYSYSVSHFIEASGQLNFSIQTRDVNMVYIDKDTLWDGQYNNQYIANNSSKIEERIGHLPVDIFPGFRSHYYVELRLLPSADRSDLLCLF